MNKYDISRRGKGAPLFPQEGIKILTISFLAYQEKKLVSKGNSLQK